MRKPVSGKQNIWLNSETVDDADLTLEQQYNDTIQSGLIKNHLGNGVLLDVLQQTVLFDSNLVSGLLDGKAIDVQNQPLDANFGTQLEVELINSTAVGKRTVKLLVIGLDFQNNLQYDTFVFHKNEKQYSRKHYVRLLKIFFNDFVGANTQSLNLGGRIFIRETKALTLSRDCVMVAQDVQPNIFFRDFFVAGSGTFNNLLVTSLPNYNIDNLNITSGFEELRELQPNDVVSQIGQKFQATSNNIQKISLLMSVVNSVSPTDLQWTGDLIISLYQLQSAVDCPLDIAPNTAIDFDPSNIPLAQLSLNYAAMLAAGFQLNGTPQPVDFIFSNTPVGSGTIIKPNSYYAITVKRAGSADKCTIQLAVGANRLDNSKLTLFNGSIWVDVPEEDLWFQVWTDTAKVSDGQAYEGGHGVTVPKTSVNSNTGLTGDFVLNNIPFILNDIYYATLRAITQQTDLIQDQRTGEQVFSEQQFVPAVDLISSTDLINKQLVSDPLVLGNIADKNVKTLNSTPLSSAFHEFGMITNQCVLKVIDDPLDSRYDLSIINLISEISGAAGADTNALLSGKIIPNTTNNNRFYRIANTEIITLIYGDLNGDGVVDDADLTEMQVLLNANLNTIPTHDQYITLTTPFKNDTALTWQLVDPTGPTVLQSGADGVLTADPTNLAAAIFNSATANFSIVTGLNTKQLIITGDVGNPGNNGTFQITGLINSTNIDIQKAYYTSDTILKILSADINGDMIVDTSDLNLLTNYVNKVAPFPAVTSPANKIGTIFTAIRLTFEEYVDRADDYTASGTRSTAIHPVPDILLDGYNDGFSVFGRNLTTTPLPFNINKQLNWHSYLVVATPNPKLVPASFDFESGFKLNSCSSSGIVDEQFPLNPTFDPGRNDLFTPNNFIVNFGGELLRPDGYFYAVDFEVGSVVFEIPAINFSGEKTLNVFTDFVADYSGSGTTRLGFQSMRFADCSFVSMNAVTSKQVRFEASLQSLSPQLDGYDDGYGIGGVIVDERTGVFLDPLSGLLTLNFTNLFEDPILQTRRTKVQVIVYLKKAGFNNEPITLSSLKLTNLLGL